METNLCARTSEVRTKHDNPGRLVIEFLSTRLEAILKQFDVSTTTIAALLVFNLILNDKGLVRSVDWLAERGRNGMMGRDTLCNETMVAFDDRRRRCFDRPFANIRKSFTANGSLLSSLRGSPPVFPAFGELFYEMTFDFRGLYAWNVRKEVRRCGF